MGVARQRRTHRYSVHLLYWYKSTNSTNAGTKVQILTRRAAAPHTQVLDSLALLVQKYKYWHKSTNTDAPRASAAHTAHIHAWLRGLQGGGVSRSCGGGGEVGAERRGMLELLWPALLGAAQIDELIAGVCVCGSILKN